MNGLAVAQDVRAFAPALAFALLMAGCVLVPGGSVTPAAGLDLASIPVPSGATLVTEEGKAVLRFADVPLPFKQEFTVPAGATIVRAVATVADTLRVSAYMYNEETGRRRCNTDQVDAWNLPIRGVSQCSGLAAIDPPGATWVATANAFAPSGDLLSLDEAAAIVGTVDVVIETTPLDGIAAQLDLSRLSMPTHDLEATTYQTLPSFDGTPLWVEVTLPKGGGPWPTVLASSPYNGFAKRGEEPAMWTYFTHDWAKRGYAVVNADVRGYGMSGGCVEVWSLNEQKDQKLLVDWIAQQPWSDGRVGFYGQSYVGTTPVEAAVQAPDALKAIIAVAPVINAYHDWHHGGVPNGESTGSPVGYQTIGSGTDFLLGDPLSALMAAPDALPYAATRLGNGFCDPTMVARANDPRAVYDGFYEERNFSKRAGDVKAAVLYTQGFEDSNVKSRMIPGWFNEIRAPKLGLFGHWVHQHPTRADQEVLFLGWMDQHVKGQPLGFEKVAPAHVVVDDQTSRTAAQWPPAGAKDLVLQADLANLQLGPDATGGSRPLLLSPTGSNAALLTLGDAAITLTYEAPDDVAFAGEPRLAIRGQLLPAGNAHFYGLLYNGEDLVTYGAFNLAHRHGHDRWEPSAPGETTAFEMRFMPTEYVLRAGDTLRLVLAGVSADDFAPESATPAGAYTLTGGEATRLILPTVDLAEYAATPATALR